MNSFNSDMRNSHQDQWQQIISISQSTNNSNNQSLQFTSIYYQNIGFPLQPMSEIPKFKANEPFLIQRFFGDINMYLISQKFFKQTACHTVLSHIQQTINFLYKALQENIPTQFRQLILKNTQLFFQQITKQYKKNLKMHTIHPLSLVNKNHIYCNILFRKVLVEFLDKSKQCKLLAKLMISYGKSIGELIYSLKKSSQILEAVNFKNLIEKIAYLSQNQQKLQQILQKVQFVKYCLPKGQIIAVCSHRKEIAEFLQLTEGSVNKRVYRSYSLQIKQLQIPMSKNANQIQQGWHKNFRQNQERKNESKNLIRERRLRSNSKVHKIKDLQKREEKFEPLPNLNEQKIKKMNDLRNIYKGNPKPKLKL